MKFLIYTLLSSCLLLVSCKKASEATAEKKQVSEEQQRQDHATKLVGFYERAATLYDSVKDEQSAVKSTEEFIKLTEELKAFTASGEFATIASARDLDLAKALSAANKTLIDSMENYTSRGLRGEVYVDAAMEGASFSAAMMDHKRTAFEEYLNY